jgi:tetratricopeptide (TPR) repeat protein
MAATRAVRRRLSAALLLALLVASTGALRVGLERGGGAGGAAGELLYLPNGRHLALMSLGHAPLLADLIYLWAIQYYSNYEREDRYRYVAHVFSNVITELDPRYIDAYWLGALILIVEARDFDAGLRLLDKGIAANPESWILPYIAAWECYRAADYRKASAYFERAARVPGAPAVVRRMRAGMLGKAGSVAEALALWGEVLEDPTVDERSRIIARRQVRELQVRVDLMQIEEALARFRSDNGRGPRSLAELVQRDYIAAVPRDPDGVAYAYDPATGRLAFATERVLRGR